MRQHRVHLERERRVVGTLGELGGALRTGEVLRHVAREPAQASVGREQERVTSRIPQSLGDRARLLEEASGLPLFDARDAADLEQRDARSELEHQGLAGLRHRGEQPRDLAAVPHSIRRIVAPVAPARVLVPARGLEVLARLLEVVGEERGVRRSPGSVDREQRSPDRPVRPAPAIQKLGAVGHFLREGMPEGVLARRLRGAEELGRREPRERRGEIGFGQIDHDAQQLRRHLLADHRRGLEHVLVARREPIDARGEYGLDGLGKRDLLDRGEPACTRRARRAARPARRASERSPRRRGDCPRALASIRAESGASAGSDPSQSSSSAEECWAARGASDSRSTRAGHAGRYSGRVVASSSARLPADSGARRRSVSI